MRLAAGHGDRVIVEDLVGDVGIGRQREAQRQRAGMVVKVPVAGDSGNNAHVSRMAPGRPIGLPSPPMAVKPTVERSNPQGHEMAADAAAGQRAFRHARRGVGGGAARAEIGRTGGDVGRIGKHRLELLQPIDARGDLFRRADHPEHALADGDRDVVGIERTVDREQPVAALRPSCRPMVGCMAVP